MFSKIFLVAAFTALTIASPISDVSNELKGRITGGSDLTLGQRGYHASLRTTENVHFCSGAILNNRWVLTAAHCTFGRADDSINIVVNTVLLNSGGVTYKSLNIVNHPSYNANTKANDISLVRTVVTIEFHYEVYNRYYGSQFIGGDVTAIITGWGAGSNNLQALTTKTLTNAECRARVAAENAQFITDDKICTFTSAGEGTCRGDGGSPLFSDQYIIGIASWDIPCGSGLPDTFVRVSNYYNWIVRTLF